MLYALGLGDRVVGVTTFCHYPPEAARKPKIGNYLRPDVETIVSLRPDLVIAEKSMIQQAISLPRLKLNLLEVDDSTIPGIYESIRIDWQGGGCEPEGHGPLRRHRWQVGGHRATGFAVSAQAGALHRGPDSRKDRGPDRGGQNILPE